MGDQGEEYKGPDLIRQVAPGARYPTTFDYPDENTSKYEARDIAFTHPSAERDWLRTGYHHATRMCDGVGRDCRIEIGTSYLAGQQESM